MLIEFVPARVVGSGYADSPTQAREALADLMAAASTPRP